MTKKTLVLLAVTFILAAVATVALGQTSTPIPPPGWQCMPYAGVAEYTIDGSCINHAPVFVYAGDGGVVLAYAIVTVAEDVDANCFYGHPGWTPVEFGVDGVAENIGANTLRGEGVEIKLIPGTPVDQACLLVRQPSIQVRLTVHRIDSQHLLLSAESVSVRPHRGKK